MAKSRGKNYKLSNKYRVFDGKRYQLSRKCGSHSEALRHAEGMRQKGLLAQVRGNNVYIKRNN